MRLKCKQISQNLLTKRPLQACRDSTKAAVDMARTQSGALNSKSPAEEACRRAKAGHGIAAEQTKTKQAMALAERKARHDAALKARQAQKSQNNKL
jgi:hypothetical protein